CLLCLVCFVYFTFFFSSRRRHTRFSRDWSSDVCSSDLSGLPLSFDLILNRSLGLALSRPARCMIRSAVVASPLNDHSASNTLARSEERRVGKECRSRWSACQ